MNLCVKRLKHPLKKQSHRPIADNPDGKQPSTSNHRAHNPPPPPHRPPPHRLLCGTTKELLLREAAAQSNDADAALLGLASSPSLWLAGQRRASGSSWGATLRNDTGIRCIISVEGGLESLRESCTRGGSQICGGGSRMIKSPHTLAV